MFKTCTFVKKVGQKTTHDCLVADDQNILLSLKLHYDGLQTVHQVFIWLQNTILVLSNTAQYDF